MPEFSSKQRVALRSDHAGFPIKEVIRQFLQNAGHPADDLGTWSEESVDYSDHGKAMGECVATRKEVFEIAVCGTGIGISITDNKVHGIRAAAAHDVGTARLGREHNDANVLALGGRVVNGSQAIEMVQIFLNATLVGGRHSRRVENSTIIEQDERKKNLALLIACESRVAPHG